MLIGMIVASDNREFLHVKSRLLQFLDSGFGCGVRFVDCHDCIVIVFGHHNLSFGWVCRPVRFRTSQQQPVGSVGRHRHGDGHVVDHAVHPVDVGGELGDQALFSIVFGNAAQGDNAVGR